MNVTSTPRLPSATRGGLVLRRAMALALATGLVASAAAACSSDNATTTAGPAATSPPVAATSESGASTTERRSGTTAGTTRGTATPGTSRGTTSTSRGDTTGTTKDPNVLTPPSIVVRATPGNEEFCGKVATALQDLTALALGAIGGQAGDTDQLLAHVKSLYADLATTAPAAIKDDVQVISANLQSVATTSDLRELDSDPQTNAAGQRFTEWIRTECGFDPNNPG